MEVLGRSAAVLLTVLGLCVLPLLLRVRAAEAQKERLLYEELTGYVRTVLENGELTAEEERLFLAMAAGLETGLRLEYSVYSPVLYRQTVKAASEAEEVLMTQEVREFTGRTDVELKRLLAENGTVALTEGSLLQCRLCRKKTGGSFGFWQKRREFSFGGRVG